MKSRTMSELIEFGQTAAIYAELRRRYPMATARLAYQYSRDGGDGLTFAQFLCAMTRGHSFGYSGTLYGGDDESFHGEGRCLCVNCGADGDA